MKHLTLILLLSMTVACAPTKMSMNANLNEPSAQFFFETPAVDIPFKDGVIVFDQDVNEESVKGFHKTLKDVLNDKPKNVLVRIQSPGGSVFAGFDMARDIEESNVPVICVVDQYAASMAFYILQACDVRVMTDRSIIMGHQVATSSQGQLNRHLSTISELIALDSAMAHFITAKSKMTYDEYQKAIAGGMELWMDVGAAKKNGFIDFSVANMDEARLLTK